MRWCLWATKPVESVLVTVSLWTKKMRDKDDQYTNADSEMVRTR